MKGIMYGVGVGPGDAEYLTIKAVKVLQECDIIGIPAKEASSCTAYRIALKAVPSIGEKPVVPVPVPMTTDREALNQAYGDGCLKLKEQLDNGKTVAFLNLGDPTVYGTYMELYYRIRQTGHEARIISGVPSFCAVAAELGIALGEREEGIHILPGFYEPSAGLEYEGTRILMKPAGRLAAIKKALEAQEEAGRLRAYAVTNCGMENQETYAGLKELREDAGYFTTIIVKECR